MHHSAMTDIRQRYGHVSSFYAEKREDGARGGRERGRGDAIKATPGKKQSARTRFIVITTKTRYATICSDVQRCGFSAHRSRSQYAIRRDDVTAKSAVNSLRLLRARKKKESEEERKEKRTLDALIDRAEPIIRRSFTAKCRLGSRCPGTLPIADDKDQHGISPRGRRECRTRGPHH